MKRFIFFAVIFYCQLNAMQQLASKAAYSSKVFTTNAIQHKIALSAVAFTSKQNFCTLPENFKEKIKILSDLRQYEKLHADIKKNKAMLKQIDASFFIELKKNKEDIEKKLIQHNKQIDIFKTNCIVSVGGLLMTGPFAKLFVTAGRGWGDATSFLESMAYPPLTVLSVGLGLSSLLATLCIFPAIEALCDEKCSSQAATLKKELEQLKKIEHDFPAIIQSRKLEQKS